MIPQTILATAWDDQLQSNDVNRLSLTTKSASNGAAVEMLYMTYYGSLLEVELVIRNLITFSKPYIRSTPYTT